MHLINFGLVLANRVLSYTDSSNTRHSQQHTGQDLKKLLVTIKNEKEIAVVTIVGCVFAEYENPISG